MSDRRQEVFGLATFEGRFLYFWSICNPKLMFITREDIAESQNRLAHPENASISDLRHAISVVDSAVHRETNEMIPWLFRRSSFLFVGIPLNLGMASHLAATSIPWLIFWQWLNQTLNCFATYYYRSATNPMSDQQLLTAYCLSSSTSALVGTMLTLTWRRYNCRHVPPATTLGVAMLAMVPALAAASANAVTVVVTRWNEIDRGIALLTQPSPKPFSEDLGHSKRAGIQANWETIQSRALLSALALVPPPVIMHVIQRKTKLFTHFPRAMIPVRVGLAVVCVGFALPISMAPWPQFSKMKVSQVEPKIAEAARAHGLSHVYFNRGI
eukprot:c3468_g1_i1.p1 GENE.c3468_g1_i1~~c3468_g1_i1.p1  ORF type:complete len:327 (-),score=39.70 c3468_g1_i1:17-997(-)